MRVCRIAAKRSGASAVEMAIVAPVFITLVLGQIEFARLGMVCQLMTTAAREGCRVAVVSGNTQTDVQDRVNAFLTVSGISVGTVTFTCPSTSSLQNAPRGTPIAISLSVPYRSVSWLGTPYFLNGATVSASATMSSENP